MAPDLNLVSTNDRKSALVATSVQVSRERKDREDCKPTVSPHWSINFLLPPIDRDANRVSFGVLSSRLCLEGGSQ